MLSSDAVILKAPIGLPTLLRASRVNGYRSGSANNSSVPIPPTTGAEGQKPASVLSRKMRISGLQPIERVGGDRKSPGTSDGDRNAPGQNRYDCAPSHAGITPRPRGSLAPQVRQIQNGRRAGPTRRPTFGRGIGCEFGRLATTMAAARRSEAPSLAVAKATR
jgi:hypothetical protein